MTDGTNPEGVRVRIANSVLGGDGTPAELTAFTRTSSQLTIDGSTLYNVTVRPPGYLVITNSIVVAPMLSSGNVVNTATVASYSIFSPQANLTTMTQVLLNQDPKFVSAFAGDFHLMNGSPAIDIGDPAQPATVDFEGNARSAAPEAGAFEY